ncbi:unnamed protein product, partial [marine sediment metagenome]
EMNVERTIAYYIYFTIASAKFHKFLCIVCIV